MSQPTATQTEPGSTVAWYRTITAEQWRVLAAAKVGWMLDAMDFMLYAMALGQLRAYFEFDDATAGFLGTVTLVMSGFGGLTFGYIADRFGRMRALMGTIVIFSLASLGASTSQSVLQLLFWRAVLGIGMGGEWASGAVLVSETWPPQHRNKAISIMQSGWALGYIGAALLAAWLLSHPQLGDEGWRWLFAAGAVPALFVLWIRRNIPESPAWTARA
jgi:MFS family permease